MPKLGARIIKTSIAVLVCLIIEYAIGSTVLMYSVIAAILCMQRGMQDSMVVSVERVAGTIFGGLVGTLIVMLFRALPGVPVLVKYAAVSLMIIPVIYLSVAFKREKSAALVTIVFLSIALSDSPDPPYLSAMVTTVDTILGIIVALLVNLVHPAPPEPVPEAACQCAIPEQSGETQAVPGQSEPDQAKSKEKEHDSAQ